MFKSYLFNSDGMYQAPIYLDTDMEVLSFAFRYKNIVPRIMVTKQDESVLEAENGEIIFPEINEKVIRRLNETTLPMPKDASIESLSNAYQDRVDDFIRSKGKDIEIYRSMIQIENDMFALAARDKVNLSQYGWKSSGVIEAELNAMYDE